MWAEPSPDGAPPNNWLDASGESAWTLDAETGQYYLHNFLPSQPDLNWWDPRSTTPSRRSSASGLTGVLPGSASTSHTASTRTPPFAITLRCLKASSSAVLVARSSASAPTVPRRTPCSATGAGSPSSTSRPRLLLGETCVPDAEKLARYYGQDDELQLAFNFPFMAAGFTAPELSKVVRRDPSSAPRRGCPGLDHVKPRQVAFHYPLVLQ